MHCSYRSTEERAAKLHDGTIAPDLGCTSNAAEAQEGREKPERQREGEVAAQR